MIDRVVAPPAGVYVEPRAAKRCGNCGLEVNTVDHLGNGHDPTLSVCPRCQVPAVRDSWR